MRTRIKKTTRLFIIILISAGVSLFFCTYNNKLDKINILNDDIIVNLLSGLLALSIAVITLIYTLLDKIREKLKKFNNEEIDKKVAALFKSLQNDTWAILIFLVTIIVVILLRDTDVPLAFFAIADIVSTLFSLLNTLSKIPTK
ncbi:hypothetical protein [Paenibacillus piri]|uniref:Uncharacterized protein n=1 Tax=Paenibacillus piri TaxID=2547395 RepID=A0A4R5KA47_9BACL|nr:hypothetical protein [Paenibacillus piri]TDF91712.1 hypothetical protein E1757_31750 [Paenibacillus piri]